MAGYYWILYRGSEVKLSENNVNNNIQETINYIQEHGLHIKGSKELLTFLQGQKLSYRKAILAQCYQCIGYYDGGMQDCNDELCPLYSYVPYNSKLKEEKKNRPKGELPIGFRKKFKLGVGRKV